MTDYYNIQDLIVSIFERVSRNFTYQTDMETNGLREHWQMPPDDYDGSQPIIGDCEDFALACRKLCHDRKVANKLLVCLTETGEHHCVLVARVRKDLDFILDCRYNRVRLRSELEQIGYKFIKISGFRGSSDWTTIGN